MSSDGPEQAANAVSASPKSAGHRSPDLVIVVVFVIPTATPAWIIRTAPPNSQDQHSTRVTVWQRLITTCDGWLMTERSIYGLLVLYLHIFCLIVY